VNPALVSLWVRGLSPKLPAVVSRANRSVVGVKVREVLEHWPPRKWAADDDGRAALTSEPGKLRLLWFSVPDQDGWFRLTATDSQGASWSTYCRATTQIVWQVLESALASSLKQSLDVAGDVELRFGP
jgi:hypothetical protein